MINKIVKYKYVGLFQHLILTYVVTFVLIRLPRFRALLYAADLFRPLEEIRKMYHPISHVNIILITISSNQHAPGLWRMTEPGMRMHRK